MVWHILEEPATLVDNPSYELRAAKLKGVGAWNPPDTSRYRDPLLDSFTEIPIPPTTKPLESFATYPHFGFNQQGEYTFVYSDPAPVGGLLHDRALLEYRSAETLFQLLKFLLLKNVDFLHHLGMYSAFIQMGIVNTIDTTKLLLFALPNKILSAKE